MLTKKVVINGVTIDLRSDEERTADMNRLIGILNASQIIKTVSDRDLDRLDPQFKAKIKLVLARCESDEYIFRPFFTVRSVWKQARLWRQSRPTQEIQKATAKLRSEGAGFLAEVLKSVGPQTGRWATNALPGQSWHQWGLAVDCFLATPHGRAIWSSSHPGYKVYADHAQSLGLVCGYYWSRQDSVHIQNDDSTVRSSATWEEIDSRMKADFEGNPD